jgi:L-rhamnose mutarotase
VFEVTRARLERGAAVLQRPEQGSLPRVNRIRHTRNRFHLPSTPAQERPVERICFSFEIYPGQEAEYKRRHDEIWPELVEAIKASGFANYSLFRRGLEVVAYVECEPDVATAFEKLSAYEANDRWSEWFEDVIVSLTDENGNLFTLQEVWHLD